VLADHCAAFGRDPAGIERSAAVGGETGVADADRLIAEAEELTVLGVGLLTIGATGPDYDLTGAETVCRWRDRR
jgi:hypothetical protein